MCIHFHIYSLTYKNTIWCAVVHSLRTCVNVKIHPKKRTCLPVKMQLYSSTIKTLRVHRHLRSKVTDDGYKCGQTSKHSEVFPYVCNPYMLKDFWDKFIKIRRYVYQFLRLNINPYMYGFLHPKIRAYGVSHLTIGTETLRSLQFVFLFSPPPQYEEKFMGEGAMNRKLHFEFFPENDVHKLCLISAEFCFI